MSYEATATNGVMIALIPMTRDWSTIEFPHLTLVYAGTFGEMDPTAYNELAKDAMDLSRSFGPQTLEVLGVETFNDGDEPVDVLIFKPTEELKAMRAAVEHWNASEHPFRPHGTIGPVGSAEDQIPAKVTFDQIHACWGNTSYTAQLNP